MLCCTWQNAVPNDWSTQDKFLIIVETASINETELAEATILLMLSKNKCNLGDPGFR
jgi:hypothetical protein